MTEEDKKNIYIPPKLQSPLEELGSGRASPTPDWLTDDAIQSAKTVITPKKRKPTVEEESLSAGNADGRRKSQRVIKSTERMKQMVSSEEPYPEDEVTVL